MDLLSYRNSTILILMVLLLSSCSEPTEYSESFWFDDEKEQKLLIERLQEKHIDFQLGSDGHVYYRPKDRAAIQEIALDPDKPSFPVPDRALSWKIPQETAKNIVLRQYPDILHNANMFGPVTSRVTSGIDGFAEPSDEVWHIRIHCNKGGAHALFFVHPESGELYVARSPDSKKSVECN